MSRKWLEGKWEVFLLILNLGKFPAHFAKLSRCQSNSSALKFKVYILQTLSFSRYKTLIRLAPQLQISHPSPKTYLKDEEREWNSTCTFWDKFSRKWHKRRKKISFYYHSLYFPSPQKSIIYGKDKSQRGINKLFKILEECHRREKIWW